VILQFLEELKTTANVANEPFGESTCQTDPNGIRVTLAGDWAGSRRPRNKWQLANQRQNGHSIGGATSAAGALTGHAR
jgi:hypothetical protein